MMGFNSTQKSKFLAQNNKTNTKYGVLLKLITNDTPYATHAARGGQPYDFYI